MLEDKHPLKKKMNANQVVSRANALSFVKTLVVTASFGGRCALVSLVAPRVPPLPSTIILELLEAELAQSGRASLKLGFLIN